MGLLGFGGRRPSRNTRPSGNAPGSMNRKKDTYWVDLKCKNCKEEFDYPVPKGIGIKQFLKDFAIECPECGSTRIKSNQ